MVLKKQLLASLFVIWSVVIGITTQGDGTEKASQSWGKLARVCVNCSKAGHHAVKQGHLASLLFTCRIGRAGTFPNLGLTRVRLLLTILLD